MRLLAAHCSMMLRLLAFVMVGTVASVGAAKPFIYVQGDSFYMQNATGSPNVFNFVGMCLRGLAHYGYKDALPFSRPDDQDTNLACLQSMGARVVRFWAAYNRISPDETSKRLKTILDKMQMRGLY